MWKEPGYQDGSTKSVTVFDLQFCWEKTCCLFFFMGARWLTQNATKTTLLQAMLKEGHWGSRSEDPCSTPCTSIVGSDWLHGYMATFGVLHCVAPRLFAHAHDESNQLRDWREPGGKIWKLMTSSS
jgi:hypothetical protein